MPYTALATKVYKDPLTVTWANSLKTNSEAVGPHGVWAWVNFDGSAATFTNINTYNVSNLVKSGTGKYVITFTTAFKNSNYAFIGMARKRQDQGQASLQIVDFSGAAINPNNCAIECLNESAARIDSDYVSIGFVGTGTGV